MQPAPNPFAPPDRAPLPGPPLAQNRRRWIAFGCVGCLGLVVAGVLGLALLGLWLVESEVTAELERHPAVIANLGRDVACELSWSLTAGDGREDYFHYTCKGSRGGGVAVVASDSTGPNGEEEIVDGELRLDDGTRIPLD